MLSLYIEEVVRGEAFNAGQAVEIGFGQRTFGQARVVGYVREGDYVLSIYHGLVVLQRDYEGVDVVVVGHPLRQRDATVGVVVEVDSRLRAGNASDTIIKWAVSIAVVVHSEGLVSSQYSLSVVEDVYVVIDLRHPFRVYLCEIVLYNFFTIPCVYIVGMFSWTMLAN